MEDIVSFLKLFCEKIWFWLVIAICSSLALFSESFLKWLGIDSSNRWLIGIVAVFSFALTVQQSCDWIKECFEHSQIKNVKETTLFNIFSEKPENTIVLKKVKMLQIKKC